VEAAAGQTDTDDYTTRIVKYIPAEVVVPGIKIIDESPAMLLVEGNICAGVLPAGG
jgi:hypothetical protein